MYKSKKSQEFWKKIINTYEKSNLSKADFCKQHKLSANRFYYWCSKLRPDLKSEIHTVRRQKSDFLPIKTTYKEKSLSISLNNGMAINFDFIPDPSWIANLIISVDNMYVKH